MVKTTHPPHAKLLNDHSSTCLFIREPLFSINININGKFDDTMVFSFNKDRRHYRSGVLRRSAENNVPSSPDSTYITDHGKSYDL